jgi:UDP-glucose 4-epimerase
MILITGGLGHIGTATVQALLDTDEECLLVQRRSPEIPDGRFTAPVHAVQADVKDLDALRAISRDHAITGIVHMAGSMPWPPNPDEAPVKAARDALGGLFNIIQVAQEWGVKRVSLASTIGVYAGLSNTGALSEELPVPLTAPHVIPTFKRIGELLGNHLAGATGLEIIHLRISGAWGPLGHLPNFAFPAPQFVYAAATGTPIDLSGVAGRLKADDGLDLCYVYDLGRATALLQTADTLAHTTYNVAAGRMTTNREVIAAIQSVVPDFELELEPGSSVPPSYLDITRLRQDTGYQPEWDVERSVADYIAYFRAGNAQ